MHSLGNCLRNLSRRPWIALLPFLVLYVVLVLVFHKDAMEGDEGRYVFFAENLSQGFYSPRDEINLWNGPGYPLVLVPLVLIFLLVLGLISVPAGIIMWRLHIPPHSKLLVFNGLCYLGACTLVSAEPRMLYVVLPIILLWFGSTLKPIVEAYWGLFPQRNRKADDIEMR